MRPLSLPLAGPALGASPGSRRRASRPCRASTPGLRFPGASSAELRSIRDRAQSLGRPRGSGSRGANDTSRPEAARSERTGGDLLSRALAGQVPSALWGLTALFGMGRGVSPTPKPPETVRDPSPAAHPGATGARFPRGPSKPHNPPTNEHQSKIIRQALDPLVPVSCECHHSSRSGLSTWWSTRGLTPSRGWESSSRGRLPA